MQRHCASPDYPNRLPEGRACYIVSGQSIYVERVDADGPTVSGCLLLADHVGFTIRPTSAAGRTGHDRRDSSAHEPRSESLAGNCVGRRFNRHRGTPPGSATRKSRVPLLGVTYPVVSWLSLSHETQRGLRIVLRGPAHGCRRPRRGSKSWRTASRLTMRSHNEPNELRASASPSRCRSSVG
jgi:hypothetical protein